MDVLGGLHDRLEETCPAPSTPAPFSQGSSRAMPVSPGPALWGPGLGLEQVLFLGPRAIQGILGVWDGHVDPTLGHCHYFCTCPWICPFTKHLLCAGTEARAVNKPDLIHPVAPKTSENKRNA